MKNSTKEKVLTNDVRREKSNMNYMERYQEWCNKEYFDEEIKRELKEMESNEQEIKDSFYQDLEFGTGGLRGIIGARNK